MAQNYHLILLEGFTPWSNMVKKLQSRRPPNSILQIRIFGTDNPNVMGGDRVGMSRLRWKVRLKVVKTCKKSAQTELEFLKKCYFLTDVHKYSQFS